MGEGHEFTFTIGTAATGGAVKVALDKYDKTKAEELVREAKRLYFEFVQKEKIKTELAKQV